MPVTKCESLVQFMCVLSQNSRHVARLEMYTQMQTFSSLLLPPPHSVASCLWLKICIRRTTAVRKAGVRKKKVTYKYIYLRSRKKVHLSSFKGVVSPISEALYRLNILSTEYSIVTLDLLKRRSCILIFLKIQRFFRQATRYMSHFKLYTIHVAK